MPCNCGGAAAARQRQTEPRKFDPPARTDHRAPRARRTGGPGEPGYYARQPKPPAA